MNPRVVTSAAAIALTCAVTAAAYFYRSRYAELNEVMVFCQLQLNAYSSFDKLMSHVDSATKSVSVCMPGIKNPAIKMRLYRLIKERNIQVRIIIDHTGYDSTDFLLEELIEVGAEIKCQTNLKYPMRHKFCLIDNKVLMTGTLNWGNDLTSDHWNYVYITSKKQLVQAVCNKFNYMWYTFSTIKHESHTDHNGNHKEHDESDKEHNENPREEHDERSITEKVSKCNEESLTFSEYMPTPEITITAPPL